MMLLVEICGNNMSIFSVSALTVFQFLLLRDGNVVFFSDIIIVFRFIFSSCISVYSVFECMVFR